MPREKNDSLRPSKTTHECPRPAHLYTRYPIVARALGLAAAYAECAFRPSTRASKGILHTTRAQVGIVYKIPYRRVGLAAECTREQRYLAYNCGYSHSLLVLGPLVRIFEFAKSFLPRHFYY